MAVVDDRESWRKVRLRQTLLNAASLPFYQDHWGSDLVKAIISANGHVATSNLPVFDKETYVRSLHLFRPGPQDDAQVWVNHTTGTTGESVPRYRPVGEVEYLEKFLSRLHTRHAHQEGAILTSWEWRAAHGNAVRIGVARHVRTIEHQSLSSSTALTQAIMQPCEHKGMAVPVGTLIMGLDVLLRATYEMESAGWPSHGVRTIVTLGGLVTESHRDQLERLWGARLIDRFSASEVIGGASLCSQCAWYHPDVHALYEAVDPIDPAKVVAAGVGLLVVTEFWPLSRTYPFVRYKTGDLVEVKRDHCERDSFGFRFLGRYDKQSDFSPAEVVSSLASLRVPMASSGAPILRPAVLVDALVGKAGVSRAPLLGNMPDTHGLGSPHVSLRVATRRQLHLALTIECSEREPSWWTGDPFALRRNQPELNSMIRAGALRFDVETQWPQRSQRK